MQSSRVRRLGKVVSRRWTKAFDLNREPAQDFSLRLKAIKHSSLQNLLLIRQREGQWAEALVWQEV